jgi:hypothetical protein
MGRDVQKNHDGISRDLAVAFAHHELEGTLRRDLALALAHHELEGTLRAQQEHEDATRRAQQEHKDATPIGLLVELAQHEHEATTRRGCRRVMNSKVQPRAALAGRRREGTERETGETSKVLFCS